MALEITARFTCTDDYGRSHVILEWCRVRDVTTEDGRSIRVRGEPFYLTEDRQPVARQGSDGFQILSTGVRLQRCKPDD